MKALSIRQPWAWAILHAGKRIENRDWRGAPAYRGPILIHAAKGCTRGEYEEAVDAIEVTIDPALRVPPLRELDRGGIVGRARLVDVVRTTEGGHRAQRSRIECALCGEAMRDDGRGSCQKPDPWAVPRTLGVILADVEPLPFLVWRGELGLFDVAPPEGYAP